MSRKRSAPGYSWRLRPRARGNPRSPPAERSCQDGRSHQEDLMTISLPIDADANELLSRDPLALLIGMLLDQQVPLEKAFSGPRDLARRLGHEPTAAELAGYVPGALGAGCSAGAGWRSLPRAARAGD